MQSDELEEILSQFQYGIQMSDNTEPMLTNNRNIAEQAIVKLITTAETKAYKKGYVEGAINGFKL